MPLFCLVIEILDLCYRHNRDIPCLRFNVKMSVKPSPARSGKTTSAQCSDHNHTRAVRNVQLLPISIAYGS